MNIPTYATRIERKLKTAFAPIVLEIKDDSARHAGHAGHDPRGETHFIVKIVSQAFDGLGKIEQHGRVYETLAEEMRERVHALNLHTMSEDEYNRK